MAIRDREQSILCAVWTHFTCLFTSQAFNRLMRREAIWFDAGAERQGARSRFTGEDNDARFTRIYSLCM